MNRYVQRCMLVGAVAGALVGAIGIGIGQHALSGFVGALVFGAIGAIAGYGMSAWRVSTEPIHPYAKPPQPEDHNDAE